MYDRSRQRQQRGYGQGGRFNAFSQVFSARTGALKIAVFDTGQAGLFQALAHGPACAVKFHSKRILRQAEIMSNHRAIFTDKVSPPDQIRVVGIQCRQHFV